MLETLIQIPGVVTAVLEGVDAEGQPLLRWAGQDQARPARAVLWMGQTIDWSACQGLRAVIACEEGDEARPILLGLLDAPPQPQEEIIVPDELAESGDESSVPDVLHLKGEKELVLECGKAKIALRADGRIKILGGYILSRSTGVNKIKGGAVHVN